jgi:hypothetical protein
LVLSTDDCMSTVRNGVLSLSHPAPQVLVSTEQKSWYLPRSKSLRLYCAKSLGLYQAKVSFSTKPSVSTEPKTRSLLSMRAQPAFSESTFNLCKQVNGSLKLRQYGLLVTRNCPPSDAWRRYANVSEIVTFHNPYGTYCDSCRSSGKFLQKRSHFVQRLVFP